MCGGEPFGVQAVVPPYEEYGVAKILFVVPLFESVVQKAVHGAGHISLGGSVIFLVGLHSVFLLFSFG